MDYRSLFTTANEIHKLNGKNRLSILADIVSCGMKYEAGYMDYLIFRMDMLNERQRATYITRGKNNYFVRTLNKKEDWHLLEDKAEFYKLFSDYIKRDWLDLESCSKDDFLRFCQTHDVLIAKPKDGIHGHLVEKVITKDKDPQKLYDYFCNNKQYLIEEVISQHPKISAIYPKAVNSLRIVTIKHDEHMSYVYGCMRIGNHGNSVDNLNHGGMAVIIDMDKGELKGVGADRELKEYQIHPETGFVLAGFKIPYFKEALDMVKEASKLIPNINYVGWDVAISEKGPLLIEANQYPGHDIYQLPPHMKPDYIGLYPRFMEALKK